MELYIYNGSDRYEGNMSTIWKIISLEWRDKRTVNQHILHYNDRQLLPCRNCGYCRASGECNIDHNLFNYGLKKSDGIVILSPIYFFSFGAKAKAFLDRLYSTNLEGKMLTAITLSGSETDSRYCGFDIVKDVLKRTSEYCGSIYVEPINFVTHDKRLDFLKGDIQDRLSEFITRLEVMADEIKKG